jgi:hypothetical protein
MDGMSNFRTTTVTPRRFAKAFLLTTFIAVVSIPHGFAAGLWTNEPSGFSVLVDCPFSNTLCPGLWDAYNSAAFANIGGAPVSPSTVLDSYIGKGSTTGNGVWGANLNDARELYVGTWWSTNSDFIGICNNNNKMLFARQPAIDNNFLVWQGVPGQPKTFKWYMQAAYDNCGHPGETGMCYSRGDGTGWFEPNVGNGTVAAGSGWHKIEFYIKTSTTKTSRDGVVKWWIDGQPVGNYPSVNISAGGLQEFQINHTWDGTNCLLVRDMTKDWHHYFDHIHISVGQGGTSLDQPPGPPATPNLRSVSVP